MKAFLKRVTAGLLRRTGLQYWPVRVRSGFARGARWTLFPWSSYWRGGHEPALQRVLAGLGDLTGWTCWDMGDHFGIYSVGLARRTGPTGQVAAFEPNPLSFARLERHRRMNDLTWLKPFEAGVSDTTGAAQFYTYGDLESTVTHLPYDQEPAGPATRPIDIRLVRLDDLVQSGQIRPPQLIKVDVEGHGHRALQGASRTLAASRPLLIIAIHSPQEWEGCVALLQPLGYTWELIEPENGAGPEVIGRDLIFRPTSQGGSGSRG